MCRHNSKWQAPLGHWHGNPGISAEHGPPPGVFQSVLDGAFPSGPLKRYHYEPRNEYREGNGGGGDEKGRGQPENEPMEEWGRRGLQCHVCCSLAIPSLDSRFFLCNRLQNVTSKLHERLRLYEAKGDFHPEPDADEPDCGGEAGQLDTLREELEKAIEDRAAALAKVTKMERHIHSLQVEFVASPSGARVWQGLEQVFWRLSEGECKPTEALRRPCKCTGRYCLRCLGTSWMLVL